MCAHGCRAVTQMIKHQRMLGTVLCASARGLNDATSVAMRLQDECCISAILISCEYERLRNVLV